MKEREGGERRGEGDGGKGECKRWDTPSQCSPIQLVAFPDR